MIKRFGVLALLAGSAAILQPTAFAQDKNQSKPADSSPAAQSTSSERDHKRAKRQKKNQEANPALSSYLAPYNSGGFGVGYSTNYQNGYEPYGNSGGYFDGYGMWHTYGK